MKENITFSYGKHQVTLESGEIARQADGAVMVNMEGTVVLVTAVAKKTVAEGQDFFPLTVDYQEKSYAAGRIPGGYFRREGRPSENETLVSRLIDRPLRPLFPEGFFNEVQVIASVMSVNPDVNPDIPAMIGASAAIALSGVPFNGPIGAARVGYKNGAYLLNPSDKELQTSDLDLVVAGTEGAVLMVESQANELPEDVMLGAACTATNKCRWSSTPSANWSPKRANPLGTGNLRLLTKRSSPKYANWRTTNSSRPTKSLTNKNARLPLPPFTKPRKLPW